MNDGILSGIEKIECFLFDIWYTISVVLIDGVVIVVLNVFNFNACTTLLFWSDENVQLV